MCKYNVRRQRKGNDSLRSNDSYLTPWQRDGVQEIVLHDDVEDDEGVFLLCVPRSSLFWLSKCDAWNVQYFAIFLMAPASVKVDQRGGR